MKYVLALMVFAFPASAWEFSSSPICTLTNDKNVKVTFDGQTYAIALSRAQGWPDAPVFSIAFAPFGPTISTTRHSVDGNVLRVQDTGFGNVLNGIQYNTTATATVGETRFEFDLNGAADPVERFKDCKPGLA